MRAMLLLPLLAVLTLLTGCAEGTGRLYCPPITEFPASLQARAADELDAEPPKPALREMLGGVQRDRARHRAACHG